MNIFILDYNPTKNAQAHCDRHVVKMVLETAQILSTALYSLGVEHSGYRPTHVNHPCCRWARDLRNWVWLRKLGRELGKEYTFRFGKEHASVEVINKLPIPEVTVAQPKTWAIACPPEYHVYKQEDELTFGIDPIPTYQLFYASKADRFDLNYTKRERPTWLN